MIFENKSMAGAVLSVPKKFELMSRPVLMFFLMLTISLDYRFLANIKGSPSFTALEAAAYFSFFILLADGVIYKGVIRYLFSEVWFANKYVLYYALWIAVLCFVNFFRGYGFSTLQSYKSLLPSILLLLVMCAYGRSSDSVTNIIKAYFFGFGVNIILGVMQGLFGWPRPVAMSLAASAKMDLSGVAMSKTLATGLFIHPNGFALYLIPGAILLLMVAVKKINLGRKWQISAVLLFPMLLFCFYRSQGKGAMAWALIGCCFVFLSDKNPKRALVLMLLVMVTGVVMMSAGSVYVADHFHVKSLTTMISRVQLWQATVTALLSDYGTLFFGVAYNKIVYASYKLSGGTFVYPNAHNAILNQAVNYGVVSMIFYLMMIYRSLTNLAGILGSRLAENPGIARFLTASIVVLVGEYVFEPASDEVLLQAQFFFLLSLAIVLTIRSVEYYSPSLLKYKYGNVLGATK